MNLTKKNAIKKVEKLCSKLETKISRFEKILNRRFNYEQKQKNFFGAKWTTSKAGLKHIKKTDDIIAIQKADLILHHQIIENYDRFIDQYFMIE